MSYRGPTTLPRRPETPPPKGPVEVDPDVQRKLDLINTEVKKRQDEQLKLAKLEGQFNTDVMTHVMGYVMSQQLNFQYDEYYQVTSFLDAGIGIVQAYKEIGGDVPGDYLSGLIQLRAMAHEYEDKIVNGQPVDTWPYEPGSELEGVAVRLSLLSSQPTGVTVQSTVDVWSDNVQNYEVSTDEGLSAKLFVSSLIPLGTGLVAGATWPAILVSVGTAASTVILKDFITRKLEGEDKTLNRVLLLVDLFLLPLVGSVTAVSGAAIPGAVDWAKFAKAVATNLAGSMVLAGTTSTSIFNVEYASEHYTDAIAEYLAQNDGATLEDAIANIYSQDWTRTALFTPEGLKQARGNFLNNPRFNDFNNSRDMREKMMEWAQVARHPITWVREYAGAAYASALSKDPGELAKGVAIVSGIYIAVMVSMRMVVGVYTRGGKSSNPKGRDQQEAAASAAPQSAPSGRESLMEEARVEQDSDGPSHTRLAVEQIREMDHQYIYSREVKKNLPWKQHEVLSRYYHKQYQNNTWKETPVAKAWYNAKVSKEAKAKWMAPDYIAGRAWDVSTQGLGADPKNMKVIQHIEDRLQKLSTEAASFSRFFEWRLQFKQITEQYNMWWNRLMILMDTVPGYGGIERLPYKYLPKTLPIVPVTSQGDDGDTRGPPPPPQQPGAQQAAEPAAPPPPAPEPADSGNGVMPGGAGAAPQAPQPANEADREAAESMIEDNEQDGGDEDGSIDDEPAASKSNKQARARSPPRRSSRFRTSSALTTGAITSITDEVMAIYKLERMRVSSEADGKEPLS
jgi:hypothetical protein